MNIGADFSLDRAYRYRLWRLWNEKLKPLVFVMLNPSTATETENDQTAERCERRARAGDYGGVLVVNLFALCATDPSVMKRHPEPVGRDNDAAILTAAAEAGCIVMAYGNHGRHQGRGAAVEAMLRRAGHRLHHLGLTKYDCPQHPLYVGYDVLPQLL